MPAPAAIWRPIFRFSGDGDGTSFFLTADTDWLELGKTYDVWGSLLTPDLFPGQVLPGARFGLYDGLRRVADGVILEVTRQD